MTVDSYIGSAVRIAEQAANASDQIEQELSLPPALVDDLTSSGLLQLYLRGSVGGPGQDAMVAYHCVEAIARGDGSTAWCVMVSSTTGYLTGWLDAAVLAEMAGSPADFRVAGSFRPQGTGVVAPGGYRISGQWDFCSGIEHANWAMLACSVEGESTPRAMFVPADEVEINRTWSVMGMAGTGSHDVAAHDVFVPQERTTNGGGLPDEDLRLYHPRLLRMATHAPVAAVALGLAQGAIDGVVALAAKAGSSGSGRLLQDRPDVQLAVGEASAAVAAARSGVIDATQRAWDDPEDSKGVTEARLLYVHAGHACLDAVQRLFHAVGTPAAMRANPIERRLRDLYVAMQFPAFHQSVVTGGGQALLGVEPEGRGW
ncbi:acyl-CoA dehydrogenase family protein [Candidatus Poriferisocius sp.]|uniref:acyl-CoA dehydrogenase family protein n=1 Tax=Candidatus Poriferisocius sp. TaxID=3101276 RepID=UPI003B018D1E